MAYSSTSLMQNVCDSRS